MHKDKIKSRKLLADTEPAIGTEVLFAVVVTIIILDQITKYLCNANLEFGMPIQVFPGFDLLLAYNEGAAFSFLSNAGGWQRWVLVGISTVVSCVVLIWLIRLPKSQKLLAFALALILGGAVGNLIDRFFLSYVIDFISVYYQNYRFATFNIADSAISLGAVLMIVDIFKNNKEVEVKV